MTAALRTSSLQSVSQLPSAIGYESGPYYRRRNAIVKDASHIRWEGRKLTDERPHDSFVAQVFEVDADGGPIGGGWAFFHTWRTDVDAEEDVPVFGPENDENTASRTASFTPTGPIFFRIESELWREEWIEPGERSERVRKDTPIDVISYITDASGRREESAKLNDEQVGRYLWFNPRVIQALIDVRGGGFQWHTRETGSVWASQDWRTHFGINSIGLVNVYAFDIAKLPIWQQRIWSGYNLSPDGAVSSELLDSQMRTSPAKTKAPEALLPGALDELDAAVQEWLGLPLFQEHEAVHEILRVTHRFRALQPAGILALSKDVARLTADRFSIAALRNAATPPSGEKWGSLKSLEKALATIVTAEEAKSMLTPLVGIYELRLGDAHLPTSKIEEAFKLAGLDDRAAPLAQGQQLLELTVSALAKMRDAILAGKKTAAAPVPK